MEHRTLSHFVEQVRANAVATYLGLVSAVEGTQVTKPGGYTLVRGPGPFSFCNFAAGFSLSETDVARAIEELKTQARESATFYVFVMSGDEPEDIESRLVRSGFEVRQQLVSMASDSRPSQDGAEALLVREHSERLSVAEFMARQFFWSMPDDARAAIALATAASSHTIWSVGAPNDPDAAVMLVESPDSVGLFNLCVKPELRGKGVGQSLVRSVQASSSRLGTPVVLQCGSDLVGWYSNLGFERVGLITALTLAVPSASDILI